MLAVVGDLIEDIVVWSDGPLRRGTDNPARIFRVRGGSAANVAAFAARRHPSRFIGCVGDDAAGRWLVEQLRAEGVDVRAQHHGTTGAIVILIDSDGERTMLPDRAAATRLEHVPDSWLDDVELLHVTAYALDGSPVRQSVDELVRAMRARRAPVSIDASSTDVLERLGVDRFLDEVAETAPAFVIANRDEADALGLDVRVLRRCRETAFVIKNGPDPTRVLRHGMPELTVPVPPVERIRDSTGAGDAFAAGFLTSFLADRDLRAACEGGHALAASVLRSPGATASIPVVG
ncbi:carbohydrate kinase family protein [Microbacterium sp.]|uniref:carbohydrate kinase family protein n=1 Tax=Microbacterium sp. TaxID=51671 RepID=UPI0039E708FA